MPLTPATLLVAVVLLAVADRGSELAGGSTIPGGPLDETAHLMTTLLVLWAFGRGTLGRFELSAMIATAGIDSDHIPDRLGVTLLTNGTPRPYTHSLLAIAVVLVGAALWRRRRDVLLGVALGLGIHFWRDLSEPASGVSLLWPWSDHGFTMPHASYVAVMGICVAVDAWRTVPWHDALFRARVSVRSARANAQNVPRRPVPPAGPSEMSRWPQSD
jgi:hypothetical protein